MMVNNPLFRFVRTQFRQWRTARYDYTRLVEVRVSASRLLHNLQTFKRVCSPQTIAPVLKSNAYGHGLVEVARILDRVGVTFLVVDGYYEALILRNEGIRADILVIGYSATENILRSRLEGVAFMVSDVFQLVELSRQLVRPQRIHLKIDTGMRRHGVLPADIHEAFRVAKACPNLVVEGICSHLATANSTDETFARKQIRAWNEVVAEARQTFSQPLHLHLAPTAGSYYCDQADATTVRLGIGLYGIDTRPYGDEELKLALSVVSRVGVVKTIAAGEAVGYHLTYRAPREMTLAVVPTGYGACVDSRLSNRGSFTIRGVHCPIVGSVNMNATCVDVSALEDVRPREEVEVISACKDAANSVQHIARMCESTPYVIFTSISPHLRRVVVP